MRHAGSSGVKYEQLAPTAIIIAKVRGFEAELERNPRMTRLLSGIFYAWRSRISCIGPTARWIKASSRALRINELNCFRCLRLQNLAGFTVDGFENDRWLVRSWARYFVPLLPSWWVI